MKLTPNTLQYWLPVFLCVVMAQSAHAVPMGSVSATHTVGYTQTTSGTTTLANYTNAIGVNLSDFGELDPVTYFPTSISFGGSANFPGGQLDLGIVYNSNSIASVLATNYYGGTGGGTYSTATGVGGYMWGSASVWSQNFSDVQGPLSATWNGGALDGFTQIAPSFDPGLLPTVPLLTVESLDVLGNITVGQEIALALAQPLSSGFSANYRIFELAAGNYINVLDLDLDPMLNPSGFSIPGNTLQAGRNYLLIIDQMTPLSPTQATPDVYDSYNTVAFTVAATSVPDHGTTVILLGSSLFCLILFRRRFVATSRAE